VEKKKHELLKIALRKAKGPMEAYKIPLRNWENSLKDLELAEEKKELAQGDVDKSLGELAIMKKEDLADAKTTHKSSVDKDLKEANDKLNESIVALKKVQKKLVELKQKIDAAKKVQQESQKSYDADFEAHKKTLTELDTAKATKKLGDEKRKILDAAKDKATKAEKKAENSKLKLKGDTNKSNDLNDKAKGVIAKQKKADDFVKEKEKKLKDVTKLVNSHVKKINDIQALIVKKLQFINDLKQVLQKKKDSVERSKDKAREMEEIKEKARKALGSHKENVDGCRKVYRKAKKQGDKLRFKLKNEERTIHAKQRIQTSIDNLTQGLNDTDKSQKREMGRNTKLAESKFRAIELRFKNTEKLVAFETKAVEAAKKANEEAEKLKGSEEPKDIEKVYQAGIFLQACMVRLQFAKEFKDSVHKEYVNEDSNWLLVQNIAEFDKRTREKEVALHKAYENPKEYNIQECEEAFFAARKKYINELKNRVSKKAKDIKTLKQKISDIDTDQKMNPIAKDKKKALFDELLVKEEAELENLEETTESKIKDTLSSDEYDRAKKAPVKAGLPSDVGKLKDSIEKAKQTLQNAAKQICSWNKQQKKQVCGKFNVSEVTVAKQQNKYEEAMRALKTAQTREALNLKISIKLTKAANGELDEDDLEELEENKKREKKIAKEVAKAKKEKELAKKKKLSKAAQEADTEQAKEESNDKKEDKNEKY